MKAVFLLSILLLAACSGKPVEPTRYYLLRSPVAVESGEMETTPFYSLGRVEVAAYIDQPGLVLESGSGEIHMARQHQWAEPLGTSLRRFLALGIGAEAGQPVALMSSLPSASRIDVTVDQLHGNSRGEAVLVAYWEVIRENGTVSRHQFSEQRGLGRDGYTALVEAEQALLQQLAVRIGQSL
jgi:uncharacterized lipoprotein YmbA